MEYAFKMFNKDLTCTMGKGQFQYEEGKWFEEPDANCAKNGFHCAKNPLDCLSYYRWNDSVCYLVEIGGDIDEDAHNSKISCTRMRLHAKLSLEDFVTAACRYIYRHPLMPDNTCVKAERAIAGNDHFCIARGKDPKACGKLGDLIALLQEKQDSREIRQAGVFEIDGVNLLPDTWYNVQGVADA